MWPDKTAIVDGRGRPLTFSQLSACSSGTAKVLMDHGIAKGDPIGVLLHDTLESVITMFAICQIGALFVNLNSNLKTLQLTNIIRHCGINIVIAESQLLARCPRDLVRTFLVIDSGINVNTSGLNCRTQIVPITVLDYTFAHTIHNRVIETDPAAIVYTSGSTGGPKGVVFSHRNLIAGAESIVCYLGNTAVDSLLSPLPLSFSYGLSQVMASVMSGAKLVLHKPRFPGDLLRVVKQHQITGIAGVPTFWQFFLMNERSLRQSPLRHLRYITNSGSSLSIDCLNRLRALLPQTKIYLMYGMTETLRSTYLPPDEIDRGARCIGKAIPNSIVLIVRPSGEETDPGEIGELIHAGPTVAMGYWNDPLGTARTFQARHLPTGALPVAVRVVKSGDFAYRDDDGFIHFVGRQDNTVKSLGYRVSLEEIEQTFEELPYVEEAIVLTEPDLISGVQFIAAVKPKNSEDHPQVQQIHHDFGILAPNYMKPKDIRLVNMFPTTSTGKIDRRALKQMIYRKDGKRDRCIEL